ncbi:MAG: hypothetical protein WKF82_11190 [Nocardioidaceae bacterium]
MTEERDVIEVARSVSERGEVVLRRRVQDGALELRVNGVFVMDTRETGTERLLASAAISATHPTRQVLIGGLGLGFTLAEMLRYDEVARVVVAEIEPALVEWHRRGLIPQTREATHDARVSIQVGEIQQTVERHPHGCLDLMLLDVDNGPGYLIYEANADIYRDRFLSMCRSRLAPGGRVAIWANDEAPDLEATMHRVFDAVDIQVVPVDLGTRQTTYHLFIGHHAP